MLVSIFLAVNRLLEWLGKSHLDWLVARATEQMAPKDGLSPAEAPNPKHDAEILEISDDEKALLDELVDNPEIYRRVVALIDGRRRESLLTDWFERAASDFQNEEFSQEAFRTFSEVHKSARESVETTNEKLRREIIEVYVSALLKIRDAPIRRLPPTTTPTTFSIRRFAC